MPLTPETWLAEFTANTTSDDFQGQPRITQLSNGNILIVWTSFNNTGVGAGFGSDIIGQLYDPFGTAIGSETRLNDFFQGQNEADFDIAALDNGRFVVVYEDENNNLVDQTIRAKEWATDADGFITPPHRRTPHLELNKGRRRRAQAQRHRQPRRQLCCEH